MSELALKLRGWQGSEVTGQKVRSKWRGSEGTGATLVHGAGLKLWGHGACAHEDENGGDDREEDSEAQHNAAARGGAHVKSRSTWLGA